MTDERDLSNLIGAAGWGGWLATLITALGLWLIKKLLSSQFAILLEEHRQLQRDVTMLTKEMAMVKAIIRERGRKGQFTWPGDAE